MKICSVEDCNRVAHAKTMCEPHYRRTRRHGSPTGGTIFRTPQVEVCTVESCDSPGRSKGYCNKHYTRYLKYGNPEESNPYSTAKTLAGKLAEGTPTGLPDTECWEWTKSRKTFEYGTLYYEGKPVSAHRVAYELANGTKIPDGVVVRHKCDNPPCVNPRHLETGTQADNVSDMMGRGRGVALRGSNNGHSKLTEDMVLRIRNQHTEGVPATVLAEELGVSTDSIYLIVRRKTWKHI